MNENNPPMVLPNGYVYGENVSVETHWPIEAFLSCIIAGLYTPYSASLRSCQSNREISEVVKNWPNS